MGSSGAIIVASELPSGAALDTEAVMLDPTASGNVIVGALATTDALATKVTGDSVNRFVVNTDGKLEWGPGNGAVDTNLYRTSADRLKTDDAVEVAGAFVAISGDANLRGATAGLTLGAGDDWQIRRSGADEATVGEGDNIAFGTATGSKIGTSGTQKIGFFGATPVIRPTGVAVDAAGIHGALVTLGLITA